MSGGSSGVCACGRKMSCQTRDERGKTKRREDLSSSVRLHGNLRFAQRPDSFQTLSITTDQVAACSDTTSRSAWTSAERLLGKFGSRLEGWGVYPLGALYIFILVFPRIHLHSDNGRGLCRSTVSGEADAGG